MIQPKGIFLPVLVSINMQRRVYLSALGAGLSVLTGCTQLGGEENSSGDPNEEIKLDGIRLNNNSEKGRDVSIIVVINEKIEYWDTNTLAAGEIKYLEPPEYEYKQGFYKIYAKTSDDNIARINSTDLSEASSCYYITAKFLEGKISFTQSLDSERCRDEN